MPMNVLYEHGILSAFHYAPLHYLAFITRAKALYSKTELGRLGFSDTHFRSTSRQQDAVRGFANYVHLTLQEFPPIVAAKLKRGFPHFTIEVPTQNLREAEYDLCRYNIAKTRYLRRGDKAGVNPGQENGFYHGRMQIPIARGPHQQNALLEANYGKNMIELLVPNRMHLPEQTKLHFHHRADLQMAVDLLEKQLPWVCVMAAPNHQYSPDKKHFQSVQAFFKHTLDNPNWRGNGLEFDRL